MIVSVLYPAGKKTAIVPTFDRTTLVKSVTFGLPANSQVMAGHGNGSRRWI